MKICKCYWCFDKMEVDEHGAWWHTNFYETNLMTFDGETDCPWFNDINIKDRFFWYEE